MADSSISTSNSEVNEIVETTAKQPAFLVSIFTENDENANALYVGTYALNEDSKSRQGSLELWQHAGNGRYERAKIVNTSSGVFRLYATSLQPDSSCLLCPLTDGQLAVFDMARSSLGPTFKVSADMLLCCALPSTSETSRVVCGTDAGTLCDYSLHRQSVTSSWRAHSLDSMGGGGGRCEVWQAEMLDKQNLLSGADDGRLKLWDLRATSADNPLPVITNKSHGAGVTFIRRLRSSDQYFLSGSYDQRLRLFDLRMLGPKRGDVAELALDGGVWHADMRRQGDGVLQLAVSCMYGGHAIVSCTRSKLELLTKHASSDNQLIYGAAWLHKTKPRLATCSFYDRKLMIHLSDSIDSSS